MQMKQRWLLFGLFGLLWLLAACGGNSNSKSEEPAALVPKPVTITATDNVYDIHDIEVTAGQPLRLTLKNEGTLAHDFSIMHIPLDGEVRGGEMDMEMEGHDMSEMEEEPEVHVAAMIGGDNTISFTPSEPGVYEYHCTVEGHKEGGMVGTLTVTAP